MKIKDFHRETEIKYDYLFSKRGKKRKCLSSKFVKPLIINATEVILRLFPIKPRRTKKQFDPLTPMSDQDRFSPQNINAISYRHASDENKEVIN